MPSSIVPSLKCRMCLKLNPPGSRFCNYCGNDLTFSIQPDGLLPAGVVLRGSYVIEGVIGEGGMGVVYSCHHKTLGTRYALKVLDPKLARIDVLRRRFLAEAKIQATVVHPHIVHVNDVIDSDKDGGIPGILAIVMEYVEGEALDQILEKSPLSERDAVSSALVVLDAIGFAHHAGIVHRDLKPSNIMVSRAESQEALYRGIKVMDFGIAKLLEEQEQRTVTGAKMGTPRYMAPEQIENARDVDERTDLYAIGLTLYEFLCGRTPFEEYKEFELLKAQLSMKPPSLRTYRSDISDRLEAIVMKSLEKDRANRYQNAESFQRALLSLGGYDDIALRLNPNEGAMIAPNNQKLQRKIERAIDRTRAKNNENGKTPCKDSLKGIDAVKASDDAVNSAEKHCKTTAKPTSNAIKNSRRVQNRDDLSRLSQAQKTGKEIDEKSGFEAPTDAYDRTISDGKIRRVRTQVKVAREKLTETSSRAMRRSKSVQSMASAKDKKTDLPESVLPKNKAISENSGEKPVKTEKVRPESGKPASASTGPKKSLQNKPVVIKPAAAEEKPRKRKSVSAVKLVVIFIVLLCLIGLIYRSVHEMAVPQIKGVPGTEIDNNHAEALQDVSEAHLVEKRTDTGMMTVLPKAEHWIYDSGQKALHRQVLDGFAIDQVEVSYFQYNKCVEAGKCPPLATQPEDLNMPVTDVGYGTAEAFCAFAGKKLPTAEQWEAAARFGGDTDGLTGVNVTCESIHCGADTGGECRSVNPPHPESVYQRVSSGNPGHLINMLGNVREWTSTPGHDPQSRVTKGGSYRTHRADIHISASEESRANVGSPDLGFRCVM